MSGEVVGLRRRLKSKKSSKTEESDDEIFEPETQSCQWNSETTYWLTRVVFLRSLGLIYFVAFLVALNQNKALIGQKGILPATNILKRYKQHFGGGSLLTLLYNLPTLLWLVDSDHLNFYLDTFASIGIVLSLYVLITGAANAIMMTSLWVLYHSIVNVGQTWYSFGWESQLLETGFLAIFFCPLFAISSFPRRSPPSIVVVICYRWLIFRIMLGAGLIKIRGDICWRDLTCMNYHYQTQPVPNPLSYYMHQSPEFLHKLETIGNHIVELVIPFLLFYPRKARIFAGCVQILFQIMLIVSGNLSFLNWLTILPSICCFDDKFFQCIFSESSKQDIQRLIHLNKLESRKQQKGSSFMPRSVINFSLFCLISYLSVPVVLNMLSPGQVMNRSFSPLRIVNTYGAFGSVTKTRTEVIIQGTNGDPHVGNAEWLEYEFHCKPGNISHSPCIISPYHYRLDWLMWFAAFQNAESNPWFVRFMAKLLLNDEAVSALIEKNPFRGTSPPKYVRALHYKYEYTKLGSDKALAGKWWTRRRIGEYLRPVNLEMLREYLTSRGFDPV